MHTLHLGDCRDVLATMDDNSIDAIVCDPPYELGFMGKAWDASGIAYDVTVWAHCLRVLKPGGHLIAFGGSRTYHRLAVAIEDAGFERRDQIQWIYGSGFPKSLDVSKAMDKQAGIWRGRAGHAYENDTFRSFGQHYQQTEKGEPSTDLAKQWHGWGTALKPAHEPAVLARKPLRGTVADNVGQWGTGALNIEGTRVGYEGKPPTGGGSRGTNSKWDKFGGMFQQGREYDGNTTSTAGRWPSNVILDEDAAQVLDGQSGKLGNSWRANKKPYSAPSQGIYSDYNASPGPGGHSDSGGASRFFYVAKASKAEREAGLDGTCTVKYNIDKSILGGLSWKDVSTAAVLLLQRVTSDLAALKWHIGESGESITALYPSDSLFITSMETNKITALKTCNLLMRLLTNDCTADVNCVKTDGTSHAENAESLKAWMLSITNGKAELALGAVNVVLTTLLQVNETEPLQRNNFHSTVKPLALMRYLVRMVTPPGGVVLDPFMGSGSTGCAAVREGFDFVGIDLTPEYVAIAQKRIDWHAVTSPLDNVATMELHEEETDA